MKFIRALILNSILLTTCRAFDTAHFFRPPFLERGPWLERDWLSALFINIADGKTEHARNCAGDKVPLLEIYGTHNIHAAALNITNPDPVLAGIAALPAVGNFGTVAFSGQEHITELVLEWYQNFKYGLFLHFHLPVRWLSIRHIGICDLSNPASNSALWQNFLQNYPAILQEYGLSACSYHESSPGDFGIGFGWTNNYECFEHLDFLDTTIQLGVTTPTSKRTCGRHLLDIPLGYNGHTGIFGKFDMSIGALDWITCALYAFGMGFTETTNLQRIKTDPSQTGLVLLERQPVREKLGTIAACGFSFKADHVMRGFSFDVAYQFQHQAKSSWFLCESQQCYTIPDERLRSWSMHTVNVECSFDFSDLNHPCLPTVGVLVNIPVAGKRILTPTMAGISCSIMTSWDW